MADFHTGTSINTLVFGSPVMVARSDRAQDLSWLGLTRSAAGGNRKNTVLQCDSAGAMRVTTDTGKASYRATMNFTSDSTGTDVIYFQGNGTVAQTTLTPTGLATAGTFTISDVDVNGQAVTTAAIAYNASAATVQAALTAILGPNVFVTGGPLSSGPTAFVLNYIGDLAGPHFSATADVSGLTGTTALAATSTTTGVAGNVQTIKKVTLSLVATAAGTGLAKIIRTIAIPVGGTAASTNVSLARLDQGDNPSNAVVKYYTGHPTVATAVDVLAIREVGSQAVGTYPVTPVVFEFSSPTSKGIKLRGAADILVINLAAALTGTGNIITAEIEYDEEGAFA